MVDSSQHSKLKRQLARLHRQTIRDIKTRIRMAKSELALYDYTRMLSNVKNALVVYSTAIINGASRGTEAVSTADKSLSKQKAACAQNEKKNHNTSFTKEEEEFNTFINGLIRRVEKCCEGHRKAEESDEFLLEALCNSK